MPKIASPAGDNTKKLNSPMLELSWIEKILIKLTYGWNPAITKTIWVFNQWRRGIKKVNIKQLTNKDKRDIARINRVAHLGMPIKEPGRSRKVRLV